VTVSVQPVEIGGSVRDIGNSGDETMNRGGWTRWGGRRTAVSGASRAWVRNHSRLAFKGNTS